MHLTLTLEKTAYTREQLQLPDHPQIAMAGRSNVGKSTLINTLAGRKHLAKTSSTPGKTRSINFYLAQPGNFYLVDLPGYGYARCSRQEREKWARLIQDYLPDNPNLVAVVLLLDSRIPPQNLDLDLARYVSSLGVEILPVLTKADKCNQKQKNLALNRWKKLLDPGAPSPLLFSAWNQKSREQLLNALQALLNKHSAPVHPENLKET